MWIKICAHTSDEEGQHEPGEILDMREGTAREWVKRGWAIARPDLEAKPVEISQGEQEGESEQDDVETTDFPGAPENALSRRGRKGKKK